MRPVVTSVVIISVAAGLWHTASTSLAFGQGRAVPAGEVVILQCRPDFVLTPHRIRVVASDSSKKAPTVPARTPCAEALSDLLKLGFKIVDVRSEGGVLYTLVADPKPSER